MKERKMKSPLKRNKKEKAKAKMEANLKFDQTHSFIILKSL
jgi:hypothetical protein